MKHSFKIFTVIIGLLVMVIILRLNSISYPRDAEDNTEVNYLEEFHESGSLFDIGYKDGGFYLKPFALNIKVKGQPAAQEVEIRDSDLVTIGNRRFLFNVYPRARTYREVYRHSLGEAFRYAKETRYMGGWTSVDRRLILSKKENQELLKKLLVEIEAGELEKIVGGSGGFDGKLLELSAPEGELRVKSSTIRFFLVKGLEEQAVEKDTSVITRDGDILKIPYLEHMKSAPDRETGLYIKFNISRSWGIDYLIISYLEKESEPQLSRSGPGMAILESLDTGILYNINKTRNNAFIGAGGLFCFNMKPAALVKKLYIPDGISEGGVVDIQEMLDSSMYYSRGNRYYPVTEEFLQGINEIFNRRKDIKDLRRYLEENRIDWRDFTGGREYEDFVRAAEARVRKMENKGVYQVFVREIEKLNSGNRVVGVGLGVDRQRIGEVGYKIPGRSWLNARTMRENTPVISGIDTFYWGAMIGESDEPVEFKIPFTTPVARFGMIAPADYGISFDGKNYTRKNFFDGVQEVKIPAGEKVIFIKVWNLKTFNRSLGATNFQAEVILGNPDGRDERLTTDQTWKASINTVHWSKVLVNPSTGRPDPGAGQLKSIWYDETWNPIYNGIKFRYFRKRFRLKEIPPAVSWKIFTIGNYIMWVNHRPVQTGKEFRTALKKGNNVLTVMVSRRGYRKNFYTGPLLEVKGRRIFLKQKREQRASFKSILTPQKPSITDLLNTPLVYSPRVNGEALRFYAPITRKELSSFFGDPAEGVWGVEQIFARLYREEGLENIRLTINSQWQALVTEAMKQKLLSNREKELKNPEYVEFSAKLAIVEAQMRQKRDELAAGPAAAQQALIPAIIELQDQIEALKSEINKIKNPFYEAAVVLMDSQGEIRVAATYPYDDETMKELNPHVAKPYRPGENPYFNRAWAWKYNPGSTAKLIDSIAFIRSLEVKEAGGGYYFPYLRALLTSEKVSAYIPRLDLMEGSMLNGKAIVFHLRNFREHEIPPGFCSLEEALIHSYNSYFSFLALHNQRVLTHDSLVYNDPANPRSRWYFISKANIPISRTYREYPVLESAERMLVNRKIDLLYNMREWSLVPKLVRRPDDAFMAVESRLPVNAYDAANIAHYSIGQGDFQITALQNAMIASVIIDGGVLYYPSVIKSVEYKEEGKDSRTYEPGKDKFVLFPAAVTDRVKGAMKEVVLRGTAGALFLGIREGREFYAKTGTAETQYYQDNSLLVGGVRMKDGTMLIYSVIVPRSGTGAEVAGKLAEEILKAIIEHEEKKGGKV